MIRRPNRDATIWLMAGSVVALRLATLAPDFGGVSPDTGNYLLGMADFAPELARPHLPGSWLLVMVLRALEPLWGAHGALQAFAVMCSAVAAGLAPGLFRRWFDPATAWMLTAVVFTQPLVWFFGIVPEVYAFDLFFGVLAVRLGLSRRGLLVLPVVFALGVGLRPTTPMLLLPLYGYLWWTARDRWSVRAFWAAHVAGAAILALVTWPLLASVGGPAAYVSLFRTHMTVDWSPLRNLWGMSLFLATVAGTTLALVLGALAWRAGRDRQPDAAARQLLLVWLLPPGLFFLLGHYQKGYALLILVPLLALLTGLVVSRRRGALLTVLVLAQCLYFLAAPYRTPAVDVYVAPEVRSLSLPEVWWQRVNSTHLMAADRPRALGEVDRELEEILVAFPDDTVLVDPTFPLFLRALQVRHPERAFAQFDVHRRDGWRLHAGLIERSGTGVAALLTSTLLVTRPDFAGAESDLSGATVVHRGKTLIALRIPADEAAVVAARYAELFDRRGP